jgi:predicted transcriptional regulator
MATTQVAFRLPNDLLQRVDAYAEQLRREEPGRSAPRAEAVRVLLIKALEAEGAAPPKKKS